MRLKHVLRDIEPDCANLVHGRLLEWSATPPLWHADAAGGVHPINLAAPKAAAVQKALVEAGIDYRYLPSYSPDPWGAALPTLIEPCWAKLKTRLRAKAARSLDALEAEFGPAPATITAANAEGWSRLCGYVPPN